MRILLAVLALFLSACASAPRTEQVTGRVLYLERVALPRPGNVRVTLQDVSRADAPAEIVAEQTIDIVQGSGPPFSFALAYDPARIQSGHVYVVRAEIYDAGGDLRYTTTDSYPVLTRGAPRSIDVTVRSAAMPPTSVAAPSLPAPRSGGHGDAELRARGIDFRAVGQEPGWLLDMYRDRIELSYDYGNREVAAPRPRPILPAWPGEIYEIRTEAHRITIDIRRVPCEDVMSGERFPARVTVVIDGRTLEGCGRGL